ncbi:MAG: hypothetical protein Q7N50_07130 [Armatimonadota bacterium]|nr:hypothetical protein [Armatimonadota bacterium]
MRRLCLIAMAILVFTALNCSAVEKASQSPGNSFKTKTKSVAIFKDGFGFFLREGKAALQDGWCMTDYIPKAAAGTFWLYTLNPGTAVNTIRSTSKNEIRFESPTELAEALGKRIGLQVSVKTEDAVIEGDLIQVLSDMALVKSGKQISVVKMADIKSVRVLGNPLLIQVDGAKAKDVTVKMGYLQQGINWVPTYTLDLASPTEARMTLRATITNGVEDLSDCNIFFVVGVPNFMLKNQLDPLTVHALGTSILTALPSSSAGMSQLVSNAQIAEMGRAGAPRRDDYDRVTVPTVDVPGEGLQDLYFYEKNGLDIAAGDVVMTTVMTATLPYRSLFTWNADAGKEVEHFLVIRNNGAVPLTTGPVMVVQNGKPLGQDQMKFISPKSEGRLKLTQTTDIRTDKSERELERGKIETFDRTQYIPVTIEGRLALENYRKEAAQTEVSWSVNGKVLEASDNADIRADTSIEQGLNPKSALKCTVKVEPGQKKVITYKYVRYVQARV